MSEYDYDFFVIGAGSGGVRASRMAASFGAKVAVAEAYRPGGTCVIRGCVPKKLLVYGAAFRQQLEDAASYGWKLEGVRCEPATLLRNVRAEVDRLNQLHIGLLTKAGVSLVPGWGRFLDPHHVEAIQSDGSQRQLRGERLLVAVGGRPQRPDIPGAALGWVSDDLFELDQLPARIVVVGAGYIACEFACLLRGLG